MTEQPHKSAFCQLLRTHRQRRGLSMSAVARAIQVSVVYYRDVERGTRRPFSGVRIDFAVLAKTLGTDADELQRAAAGERGQLELDLRGMNADMRNLAVLFANCVSKRRLAKATIGRLRQALRRAG